MKTDKLNSKLISEINLNNSDNWSDQVFITMDIDWAPDFVIEDTLSFFENIKLTLFVTHKSKILNSLVNNNNFELGIHPNFNFLLNGDFRYGDTIEKVIEYYLEFVPNSKSVRSHSLANNSHMLDIFTKKNIVYDCNIFIPYYSTIKLNPWLHWDKKLIRVPYFWEDDVQFMYDPNWLSKPEDIINSNIFRVFNFHPIHIFLNTENIDRYIAAKPYLNNKEKLKEFINKSKYGTKDFLVDLIR
ncbi:hypothetical protein DID75_00285 [Candidatus Marinamargulisbacteria bacterium SCGC AG-410-N11]|nr:hypothetical protein DID75_00285 [Candidatus Marinamargulisbacteria bacterium SCGC AG-410-N11]